MTNVSVIVPIYNADKYLNKCINSILNQTLQELEIILVDDGSTDESGNICDQYSYLDNVKIVHQENKGLSAARNVGLDLATGEYVAFLDSDDYVDSEMYNELYTVAKRETIDIVYCNYAIVENDIIISDGGKYLPPERKIERDEIRSIIVKEESNRVLWFAVKSIFRRELLVENDIRFREEKIIEDTPFNLDVILSANSIWFINKRFYYYVQTPNSLIRSSYKKDICEKLNNCYKAIKEISEKHGLNDYKESRVQYNMRHSMVMLLTNEIHSPHGFKERLFELKRIRESELAKETFDAGSVFCINSRIKWIMLLLKLRLFVIVILALYILGA